MSTVRTPQHPIDAPFTQRWSPRAFASAELPQATLMAFLEAARWAPSASNQQPWRFAYGLAGTAEFDALLACLAPGNQVWAGRASALVVVASQRTTVPPGGTQAQPNAWHAFDAGAAWMCLALQAHQAGWATHAMGGFDAAALRAHLALPADVVPHVVVAVGRQGEKASLPEALQAREQPNGRKPLAELLLTR